MKTLEIKNLNVKIEEKQILKDFSLTINEGEIHAIMGPNGTGKSTLAKVIMGDPSYKVISGSILVDGKNIIDLEVYERARLGIFLGMQSPTQIEGVTNADFLRTALNSVEGNKFSLMPFIKKLDKTVEKLKMNPNMIHRGINQGFSGGERKKNEILQMYMLNPSCVLLDEIDSGLDVDSLKIVGENVMEYFKEFKPTILVITHYQRLLDYIKPHYVHIMKDGHIVKTGDSSLVKIVENLGYDNIEEETSTCIGTNK
ncbi:MAG: Fe-S cluster assembly ATPase SufC [Bacilli bacterium]